MAIPGGALKDGMGSREIRVDTAVADAFSGGTLAVAAGEVGADELATNSVTRVKISGNAINESKIDDDAVTASKLAVSYNMGHFTLGTNGAEAYVGFSGGGEAVTMDGSPISIVITPFGQMIDDVPHVTDYSTSGFHASGNAAAVCMYLAFEEG